MSILRQKRFITDVYRKKILYDRCGIEEIRSPKTFRQAKQNDSNQTLVLCTVLESEGQEKKVRMARITPDLVHKSVRAQWAGVSGGRQPGGAALPGRGAVAALPKRHVAAGGPVLALKYRMLFRHKITDNNFGPINKKPD